MRGVRLSFAALFVVVLSASCSGSLSSVPNISTVSQAGKARSAHNGSSPAIVVAPDSGGSDSCTDVPPVDADEDAADQGCTLDDDGTDNSDVIVGGGGVPPTTPPAPPQDPVYDIQCPGAASCSSSTSYTAGQQMSCVTDTGAFTTGCGGTPGSGSGIGVIYFPDATCYVNFASIANACFASSNYSSWTPGGAANLTTLYCYWPQLYQTQHHFNVPVTPAGRTAFARYSALAGARFLTDEIPQSASQGEIPWDPHTVFPPINASPSSASEVLLWANGVSAWIPPAYIGWAYALDTSQNCPSGINP